MLSFFFGSDILFYGSNWRLVTQVVQQLLMFGGDSGKSLEVYHSLGQVRVGVSKPAKNLRRNASGGELYRPQRGTKKYNNLQLLVLMLFQNVVLQSLGNGSDVIVISHTHSCGGYSLAYFLTLIL